MLKEPSTCSSREGLVAHLKSKLAADDQLLAHAQCICESRDFVGCLLDSLVNLVQPPSLQSNAHCLLKLAVPEAPEHRKAFGAVQVHPIGKYWTPETRWRFSKHQHWPALQSPQGTGAPGYHKRLVVIKRDTHLSKSRSTIADNLSSIAFDFPSSVVSFLSWTY